MNVLHQFGITLHDAFLAVFLVGVWWGSRQARAAIGSQLDAHRQSNGVRLGAVEEAVARVQGVLNGLHGGNGDGQQQR